MNRPMTIVQMLPELNVGGVEQGVVDSAIGYARRGHHSIVISNGGKRVPELVAAGVIHHTLPIHKKRLGNVLRLIPKVARLLKAAGADIVHVRSRLPGWIGYYAARRAGVPLVTTVHGYYTPHFYSRIMARGARVIAVSHPVAEYANASLNAPMDRLRVIHRGIDPAPYEAPLSAGERTDLRAELGIPPQNRVVVMVGRITRLKGHGVFLSAMAEVCRRHPDVTPLVIGSVPPKKAAYGEELQRLTAELGLADRVVFAGSRGDVPRVLKVCDLLVSASTQPESFGRTLVEAMATGIPVVATAHGGALDILKGETCGRLVQAGNAEQLAEAVNGILERRDGGRALGESGRFRVKEMFTVERMVSDTIAVYEELLDR